MSAKRQRWNGGIVKCIKFGPLEIFWNVFWRRSAKSQKVADGMRRQFDAWEAEREARKDAKHVPEV